MIALGHGLWYVAQILGLIFAVGLYRLLQGPRDGAHRAWAMVGLLAAFWVAALGVVAQSVEGVAVWQAQHLAEQLQLGVALWGISTFVWNSILVPFSVLLLGSASQAAAAAPSLFGSSCWGSSLRRPACWAGS